MKSRLLYAINPARSFFAFILLLLAVLIMLPATIKIFRDAVYYTAAIGVVGYFITKHLETRAKRYNPLILLEAELNIAISCLYDNINLLKPLIASKTPFFINPISLGFDSEILTDVGRIDLKNQAIGICIQLNRLNSDLSSTSDKVKATLPLLLSEGPLSEAIVKTLQTLEKACEQTLKETKACLVATRFFIKKDKPQFSSFQPFYDKSTLDKWIKSDMQSLETEIQESQAQDSTGSETQAKEIDDIFSKRS